MAKLLAVVILFDPLFESFTPAVASGSYGVVDEVKGQTKVDDKLLPAGSKTPGFYDNDIPVIIFCNVK